MRFFFFFAAFRYFEEFEKRIPRAEMEKMEVIKHLSFPFIYIYIYMFVCFVLQECFDCLDFLQQLFFHYHFLLFVFYRIFYSKLIFTIQYTVLYCKNSLQYLTVYKTVNYCRFHSNFFYSEKPVKGLWSGSLICNGTISNRTRLVDASSDSFSNLKFLLSIDCLKRGWWKLCYCFFEICIMVCLHFYFPRSKLISQNKVLGF